MPRPKKPSKPTAQKPKPAKIVAAPEISTSAKMLNEMVAGGASKSRIGVELGTSLMTIMSVAAGKTVKYRKEAELMKLYEKWKAGKVDLKGQRGRRTKATAPVNVVKRKKESKAVATLSDFPLPQITDTMISDTEKEIASLRVKLQYMKDVKAIQKKYGG